MPPTQRRALRQMYDEAPTGVHGGEVRVPQLVKDPRVPVPDKGGAQRAGAQWGQKRATPDEV